MKQQTPTNKKTWIVSELYWNPDTDGEDTRIHYWNSLREAKRDKCFEWLKPRFPKGVWKECRSIELLLSWANRVREDDIFRLLRIVPTEVKK